MFKQRKSISGFFHTRSVFLQIFVSLLMFLAVLIFVVIFWINRISSQEQQRLIMRTNLNRITSADRTIEQVIDDLTGNMTQITWSKELMSYALLPVADQTKYSQIQNQLQNVARSTWVVKKAVYYCTYSKKIFQSDSSRVQDLENFYDAWMIDLDPEAAPESTLFMRNVDRKVDTYLLAKDGRLIIRQDWNMGKQLSVLLYELNTSIVNDVISNSNAHPQDNIYPFDTNGNPVLQGILSYAAVDAEVSDLTESQVITLDSQRISRDSCYYLGTGRRLPWTYLIPVNRKNMQVSLYSTIHTWLPAILILLAVSVLLSFYVVNAIYHPINRLFSIASSRPTGGGIGTDSPAVSSAAADGRTNRRAARPNEFDLLENAYSQAVDQQMKMSQMIEMVAPDIMDHMLVNILSGNNYSSEKIDGLLEGIGNPISSNGRFLMCSCVIAEPENRSVSETEWEMYLLSLRKMIQEFSGRGYKIYPVQMDRNTLAILLAFPEEWSAVAIKRVFVEVQRTLMGNAEVLPYRLWVECGQTYSHLSDSREAFLEGMEKIRFRREGEEDRPEQSQKTGQKEMDTWLESGSRAVGNREAERKITRIWIRKQIQEILSFLQKSEQSGVYLTLEQTVEEFVSGSQGMEELRQYSEWLLEELSEKAMSYPLSNEELSLVDMKQISEKLRSVADPETMQVTVQMMGRQICDLIYSYNRKNRYKYVDQAKRYIAEHYSDSNLSLNDVAEYVQISASYLSELFAEISGEKFSGYLAAYRIEKARQQLQTTSEPAKEIGSRCGFNSVQNFNRVFKKMTGLTPGQYRESAKDPAI